MQTEGERQDGRSVSLQVLARKGLQMRRAVRGYTRVWLAALLAYAMVLSGIPTLGLAEAVEEVGSAQDGEAVVEEVVGEATDGSESPETAEEVIVAEEEAPEPGEEVADEDAAIPEDDALAAQSATVADPRVVADSSMKAGQKVTWDCVWLGSYPQGVVTDVATVAALDAATGWSAGGDLAYGGATYRRLREADATYSSTSPSYWQWGQASPAGYCYFLWEPVKWRVLEADGATALVVADVALDDQRYNSTDTRVTWEACSLRSWLDQTFWEDALTAEQRGAVVPQALANADNIFYGTYGGSPTTDKVFLLAESDVWNTDSAVRHGFVKAYHTFDNARRCKVSDYARAMGAETNTDTSSSSLGNCYWWLRSPGDSARCAASVHDVGSVGLGGNYVDVGDYAVRPALSISLSSDQISYAGTVCSDGTIMDAHDLACAQVSSISVQTHTGDPIKPDFTVRMGLSTLLRKGADYTVSYANNVDVGTATVTITGAGDYHGTITRKFKIRSEADGLLGKLDLSAGFGSLKLDVPKSVPIVGGDSFSLDLPVKLPAQVVVEDGKIKFGYNLPDPYLKGSHSSAQPQKAWEWTTERKPMRQQWESFCKDVRKSGGMLKESLSKDGFLKKISDGRWKRWNVPGMQKGVEIYASLYGEYAYGDRLSDAASIEGSLVVVAKGTISLEKQWVVWVIPVTVNIDFTASATASASIGYDVANSEWYGDLDLALAIGVEPYAGVGVGKWASVGVYGSAEMGVDMKVLSRREAHGLREWYIAGEAGGRAYFAQKAFTWTMISTADLRGGGLGKYVDSGGHLRLWSKTQASVITGSKGAALKTQSESDSDEPSEAEELLATAQTVPLEAQSTLGTASADGSLVTDAYPGAEPAVVDAGGTRLLVYVGQDPSRAELDRTVLYYRVYDGSGSWSDPVAVLDDGTADCMPTVLADGGEAYVAWLDANRKFGTGAEAEPDEYLSAFSARVARWNASTGSFEDLGRPAGTDAPYAYLLALGAGPSLTWAENLDGAAFGIGSDASEVRRSSWDGSAWSSPQTLASGLNAVTSLVADGNQAAWAVDEDGDISTPGQTVDSTAGALSSADVSSLAYAVLPGTSGVSLAAAIDGGLYRYDGVEWSEVLPAGTMGAASGFCVDGDAVYYTRAGEDSSHVAVATYDAGEWGTALVTTDDGYVSSVSCPCGTVALTHTTATPVEGTSDWQTTSEVRVLPTTQRANVSLDAVDYASDELTPGATLPVTLTATNEGTSRETAVNWSALLDGVEVASGTGSVDLMPGEAGSFDVEVPLPDDLGSGALAFRAWNDGDDDDSDGTVEESVLKPDLEVTAEFFESVPDGSGVEGAKPTLSVTVHNAGTADANAATTVTTEQGDEVLSRDETIAAGESVTYTREFASDDPLLPADGSRLVLVARASCDEEEFYDSNNVDYVTASSRLITAEGEVLDQSGEPISNPDPDPDPVPQPDPDPDPDPDPQPTPTQRTSISAASVSAPAQTYTGRALTPRPTVKLGSKTLVLGTDYTVSYKNNVNAGTATVTVTGMGGYAGTKTATFKINKAANGMSAKGKSTKLSASKVRGKAQSLKAKKAYAVKGANGKLSYKLKSVTKKKYKKYFKVAAKSGKITVKKGLPKGTYKLKVAVTAAGDANHQKATKTVTVTVGVK